MHLVVIICLCVAVIQSQYRDLHVVFCLDWTRTTTEDNPSLDRKMSSTYSNEKAKREPNRDCIFSPQNINPTLDNISTRCGLSLFERFSCVILWFLLHGYHWGDRVIRFCGASLVNYVVGIICQLLCNQVVLGLFVSFSAIKSFWGLQLFSMAPMSEVPCSFSSFEVSFLMWQFVLNTTKTKWNLVILNWA